MKIYSLTILSVVDGSATKLASAKDLSSFSFYQRGTVAEFLDFFTTTVIERLGPGQRQSLQENDYTFHLYNREGGDGTGLSAALVTDREYPVRAAFSVLTKTLETFASEIPPSAFSSPPVHFPQIEEFIRKYQDPRNADQIIRIQEELDETKVMLHQTIEAVLARGEKLDDIVAQSKSLSDSSKMFFRTTKRQNSCCVVM